MTKNKNTGRAQTLTTTTTKVLSPLEEKVIRMHHGIRAPEHAPLEYLGQNNPELQAKLDEIERRAMEAVGARNTASKRKILSSLRRKN